MKKRKRMLEREREREREKRNSAGGICSFMSND
jgi:hypothetical protein